MKHTFNVPDPKTHCRIKRVAVFGSADVDEQHPLYQEAFKIAHHLAYTGRTVVNGGGPGVMLAATEGANSVGGETTTVTFYPEDMPEFEGKDVENNADHEIRTVNYIERMFTLMDNSDAFIIMQGGTGTLSEWATAWLLAHLYFGHHKPLILYGEFWHEVMDVVNKHFFIGDKENEVYKIVKNEEEMEVALNEFEAELEARGLPKNGQNGQHA